MKQKCISCGAELAEGASFCLHCETEQRTRRAVQPPRLWKKHARAVGLCLLLALVGLGAALGGKIFEKTEDEASGALNAAQTDTAEAEAPIVEEATAEVTPQTVEGGALVQYEDSDGTYTLLLAYNPSQIIQETAMGQMTVSLPVNDRSMLPSLLGVLQDGEPVDEAVFFEKVSRCTVSLSDGTDALEFTEPAYSDDFIPALRVSHLTFYGTSGTNEVIWTLEMKNGDRIVLRQILTIEPLYSQTYSPENTPLDTMEDLQALLARIDTELPPDTVVDIYLPPVTYEGTLNISTRAVNLYGGSDGEHQTTFTGQVNVQTDKPSVVTLSELRFEGSGGTGLYATASVFASHCVFTGWDVAAEAADGGMVCVAACDFTGNGVGLRYNTRYHTSFSNSVSGAFSENGIGVQFLRLSGNITIYFTNAEFSGNDVDIDNLIDYPVSMSEEISE